MKIERKISKANKTTATSTKIIAARKRRAIIPSLIGAGIVSLMPRTTASKFSLISRATQRLAPIQRHHSEECQQAFSTQSDAEIGRHKNQEKTNRDCLRNRAFHCHSLRANSDPVAIEVRKI